MKLPIGGVGAGKTTLHVNRALNVSGFECPASATSACCLRPTLIAIDTWRGQGFHQLVNLFAMNPVGGRSQVAQSGSDAHTICGGTKLNSDLTDEQRDLMIGIINKSAQPQPILTWYADFGKNSERTPTLTQM
jgi:hypothetical protein